MQGVCTFKEMWVDQVFSFHDIFMMHEMLDLKTYLEGSQEDDAS